MSKHFSPPDWTNAFAYAEQYMAKARNGHSRPIGNNTRLIWRGADSIAVQYHWTDVVTYHRDGTFTIYGGGWNTVTTKRRIDYYSPARVYSVNGLWEIGSTGELTPAKVQKCRSCSKTGPTWQKPLHCDISNNYWYGQERSPMCPGGKQEFAVPLQFGPDYRCINSDEHHASRFDQPCLHGEMERHQVEPCSHGLMGRHFLMMQDLTCHRCQGTGKVDYGSKPIPILVSAHHRFVVDAAGKLITSEPDAMYVHKTYPTKKKAAASPYDMGSEVKDKLAKVLPGLNEQVVHPMGGTASVHRIIVSLNDTYHWSREQIADWLDTLDTDLRFPAMA